MSGGANVNENFHAFRLGPALQDLHTLPTLGGTASEAQDINDKGEIVGFYRIFGIERAFFRPATPDASLQQVGSGTLCGPQFEACESLAYGINEDGVIVGESNFSQTFLSVRHAFRFRSVRRLGEPPVLEDLGTLCTGLLSSLCNSVAHDVNDAGRIVGTSNIDGGGTHAFLYANNTMIDLNSLLSAGDQATWTLIDARGMNALGQIVGTMRGFSGDIRAYLLTPTLPAALLNLADLVSAIASDVASGQRGFERSLHAKLEAMQSAVERGTLDAARGPLNAYEQELRTLVKSGRLTEIQGTKLAAGATLIRGLMEGEPRR